MNEMSRLEKINQYVDLKNQRELTQKNKEEKEIQELQTKQKALLPRVKELCELIVALDKNGLLKERDYEKKFFANGWDHKIGLLYVVGYTSKGVETRRQQTMNSVPMLTKIGGGACHFDYVGIDINGNLYGSGEDYKDYLGRFLNQFDEFEKEVFDFIDNLK